MADGTKVQKSDGKFVLRQGNDAGGAYGQLIDADGNKVTVVDNGDGTYSLKVNTTIDAVTITNLEGKDVDNTASTANPLLNGGRYDATPATRGDGDAVSQQMTATGAAHVALTGRKTQVITLANAVAITNTNTYTYDLITTGGLTEEQIRGFTEFKVSIYDTHSNGTTNATASVWLLSGLHARGVTTVSTAGIIYTESNVITNGSFAMDISAVAGGTGASALHKVVPALKGVHSNLIIEIDFTNAPTSGAITIQIEAVV